MKVLRLFISSRGHQCHFFWRICSDTRNWRRPSSLPPRVNGTHTSRFLAMPSAQNVPWPKCISDENDEEEPTELPCGVGEHVDAMEVTLVCGEGEQLPPSNRDAEEVLDMERPRLSERSITATCLRPMPPLAYGTVAHH